MNFNYLFDWCRKFGQFITVRKSLIFYAFWYLSPLPLFHYNHHHFIHYTSLINVNDTHSDCLIHRHWKVTSGINQEDVQIIPAFSHGVIGLTPTINPGETFYYTSCSALKSKEGSMEGSFLMMNLNTNKAVTVVVAPFKLIPLWLIYEKKYTLDIIWYE